MELCTPQAGASLVYTTCFNQDYPTELWFENNHLKKSKSLYMTTGSFPNEMIFKLKDISSISSIEFISIGIHKLEVSTCDKVFENEIDINNEHDSTKTNLNNIMHLSWNIISTATAEDAEEDFQRLSLEFNNITASYVRFRILSGTRNFITIRKISINGGIYKKTTKLGGNSRNSGKSGK